ncbi:hypothetical protein F0562_035407 [Nyssa sinensis]|uniref:Proteinase inhibitor I13 n=1 Tax=Nyssa sinensis TaxID=561372 RepID=A0A5J5ABU0_9ASTE|nr:hypothetical protein F0562_035407 [Nyssa sinensis]
MSSICGKGKSSWPELVGAKGETAVKTIEKENHKVNAEIVLEGSPGTADFRCDRVRVLVDKKDNVLQVPVIG